MTREEIINVIYNRADKSTCPIYCPEYTGRDNCTKCAEKLLAEYEKQIRDKALDDMAKANHIAINRLYDDIFENNGNRPSRNKIHKTLSRVLKQL